MSITLTQARVSLRVLIGDDENSKYSHKKKVYGKINGTNKVFRTFNVKRITDFTKANQFPVGIYLNNSLIPSSQVVKDDVISGEFELSIAPGVNDVLEASYYYQDFLDDELDGFLKNSSFWLGYDGTIASVPNGLLPALLHYSAHEAFMRMSHLTMRRLSDVYKSEDQINEEERKQSSFYFEMSERFLEMAIELRNSFYSGKGQENKPSFSIIRGRHRNVEPQR